MNYSTTQKRRFGMNPAPESHWLKRGIRVIIVLALAMGGWQVGSSAYLLAKAQLAQYLIADAWEETLKDQQPHPPWSWADTHPVAELRIPRLGHASFVLAGASGRNMAFGPVHSETSGMPGDPLSTVFSAHNDTHFKALAHVQLGDRIEVTTTAGEFRYQVIDLSVINSKAQQVALRHQDQLVLTTCYPFNAWQTGGDMRFQVTAKRLDTPMLAELGRVAFKSQHLP